MRHLKSPICILFCCFLFSTWSVSSQIIETLKPPSIREGQVFVNTRKEAIHNAQPPVKVNPSLISQQEKWEITLMYRGVDHGSSLPQTIMDSLKREGSLIKREQEKHMQPSFTESLATTSVNASVQQSFKGNTFGGWAPCDNNIAVSDDGFLVSVINASMLFADIQGNILMEENFGDFLSVLNLTGIYFDPKVLYDPVEDKFIMVVLNGNTPATSTVVVAFSSSADPTEDWWIYTYPGDPTGSNLWFDYPSIGVSTDDVYITGNLYTADRTYAMPLIYQFEKGPGFIGENVPGINWPDVRDAFGNTDFNIVPVSFGFDGSIGPGIYFISTDSEGGSDAMLYYTDDNAAGNPEIYAYRASLPGYHVPFNGLMLGTTDEIKTNDCRTLTGFYADGTLHFAFNDRGDDFHTKVYYCRLNTNDLTNQVARVGQQPFEFAYPAIAPFTTSITDKTVVIGFLRTNSTIYPEFRVTVCDDDMQVAPSTLVKSGESYTNFLVNEPLERWGDYSGIARRHSASGPEVWISGCYGEDNENGQDDILTTWIAQVTDGQTGAAPIAGFSADATEIPEGQSISFTDLSGNAPFSWLWSFPGGEPSSSLEQHPTVFYSQAGAYDVSLIVSNVHGTDQELKTDYVHVTGALEIPDAEFTSDVTTISAGEAVHFEDLSTQDPTDWDWFFTGGIPSVSHVQNPVVVYPEPGCYEVLMIASNAAGSSVITRECYIDVLMTSATDAEDVFRHFVLYPNPVSNGTLNVEFEIPQPGELDFSIINQTGAVIKHLLRQHLKQGLNQLSFNTAPLMAGMYTLVVNDASQSLVHSETFVVTREP